MTYVMVTWYTSIKIATPLKLLMEDYTSIPWALLYQAYAIESHFG